MNKAETINVGALGAILARVARSASARMTGRGPARRALVRSCETFIRSQRAAAVTRTALRWLRLLLSLAAASPGSGGNFGVVTQQIALLGFWQWLSLVCCLALGTPVITQVQGVGAALVQFAEAARSGPAKTTMPGRHPVRRSEEIVR